VQLTQIELEKLDKIILMLEKLNLQGKD